MMRILRMPIAFVLVYFALSAEAVVPSHAVAFLYHRFGDARYPSTNIRLQQFDAQLDYLSKQGFEVWPLERIVSYIDHGLAIPDHVIALTVDDAYQSVYEQAYPRIKTRGWPMTVFVSTDAVDKKLPDFMTWSEMREMQKHGVSFANHTADHAHLTLRHSNETELQWITRITADIDKGQKRLQAELGRQVNSNPRLFAYPYGEYNQKLIKLVHKLGYTGIGQQSGPIPGIAGPEPLPRYPMSENYADMPQFVIKANSLPLPIATIMPTTYAVGTHNPPQMTVTLVAGTEKPAFLTCYANGDSIPILWTAAERFTTRATLPLPAGRSRYNCTARSHYEGRYYWYSHPWFLLDGN